jgi:hypothetical protein
LRHAEQVSAVKAQGNGALLNGCGIEITRAYKGAPKRFGDAKVGKRKQLRKLFRLTPHRGAIGN